MSPGTHRKLWAGAAAVAATAALVVGIHVANASHNGSGSTLTSSNGTNAIKFSNGSSLTSPVKITDAAWAPDSSRAVFVDADGRIATVRFNDGQNLFAVTEPAEAGQQRRHPTWRGGGSSVAWSERASATAPWQIQQAISSFGIFDPERISPNDGMSYTHPDGGPKNLTVFQRQANAGGTPTGTPEVWLHDPASGDTPETRSRLVIANAGNPAISPDGTKVAFVRSDGTRNQIFVSDLNGGGLLQVTSNAVAHDNPAWSPDGATIAFNNGGAGVATVPADGSGAANPTTVAGLSGLPAYAPANRNVVARLAGKTRFATAIAVSRALWADATDQSEGAVHAKSVVLSRSDDFADALSGGALAAAKEGPLLLTTPTALEPSTKEEIARLLGDSPSSTVYLLGGTGAIAQPVEDELKATGVTVVRLAGPNRFATSVAIAKAITPEPELVLAATGFNFPDALAAGAAAGSFNVPGVDFPAVVLLTADAVLTPDAKTYLDEVRAANPDAGVFGIGGQAAVAVRPYDPVELVGKSRYETALITAEVFFGGQRSAGVATGSDWPDALAGGALMGTINGPLLLTPTESTELIFETSVMLDISSGSIDTGLIFGGTGVVRSTIDAQVGTRISGPGGFDVKTSAKLGPAARSRSDLPAITKQQIAKNQTGKGRPSLAKLRSLAKGTMARHG